MLGGLATALHTTEGTSTQSDSTAANPPETLSCVLRAYFIADSPPAAADSIRAGRRES